ncbi:proto-oncogene serine/threonine-protein kinase mos [Astyanax mexicanus]|uniref:non-specific serine/threonine protein kinase n=1 Tax=Astyanax mexicanus TaxID=7994 RepID=A0A8T2L0W8_ASTMX|nr:proto-oncogene serine/threonine-protein kinase mos [Astyanax mexicanus]KAG9265360.1 proto-oncogene serine/threonine-protein kinase mos [Astyanax mexicanus]
MPSPIPVTRLLPRGFGLDLGTLSSPLSRRAGASSSLRVPTATHGKLAQRLWSSAVQWRELHELEPIGCGGFGMVFKGTYFGETVAVKRVRRARNTLASRQSFWAELNAAHLRHDNLVRVIAATTMMPTTTIKTATACARTGDKNQEEDDQGRVGTIVMEFAGDVSLQQVIYGAGPLPPELCVRYASDVVCALRHLHAHGVAHLDLKPANVLVSRAGVCKLADFGCSLQLGRDHAACALEIGGTYTHRAPELLRGERVTARADVYSFGVTLWQLLTRDVPYRGERQCVIYAVVAYGLRPQLDRDVFHRSSAGRACAELVSCCWSAEPNLRPSAEQLHSDLQQISLLVF